MPPSLPSTRPFRSEPPSVASLVAALLEPALIVGCYLALVALRDRPLAPQDLGLCVLACLLAFPGRNRFWQPLSKALADLLAGWLGLLGALAVCGYATGTLVLFERALLLAWALVTPLVLALATLIGRQVARRQAACPGRRRRVVVIGAGPLAAQLVTALGGSGAGARRVVGVFDDREGGDRIAASLRVQWLGRLEDVAAFVLDQGVHEVFITLPLSSQPRIAALLAQLQDTTASLYLVPDVFGIGIIQGRLRDLHGMPVVGLCESPFTGVNRLVKRASDLVLASLILVLTAPLLLLIGMAVRLDSPGPAIFRQRRNGLDGEEIVVWKFRTMRVQEDGAQVRQATRGDPRITRLGAFLRRTSLDELPQFVNVLQGRMSIVGPRPHAVAHNALYRERIRAYMVRHKVKPGITGWAQVNGCRGETDTLEKMQARVALDLHYLDHWSLGLDLLIIARTVRLVVSDRHAY